MTAQHQLIGIQGKASSGKDEVTKVFVSEGFVQLAFADHMKRMLLDMGFPMSSLWGPSDAGRSRQHLLAGVVSHGVMVSSRRPLQTLGSWGRAFWPDCWITRVDRAIDLLSAGEHAYAPHVGVYPLPKAPACQRFVITDIRFKNEMQYILAKGGRVIRVRRPGAGLEGELATHESETEMDDVDDRAFHAVLHNDGSLAQLRMKTFDLLEAIKET